MGNYSGQGAVAVATSRGELHPHMAEEQELQRKLTTIMVADIVGYSTLAASDEDWTVRTVGEVRTVLQPRRCRPGMAIPRLQRHRLTRDAERVSISLILIKCADGR